MKSHEDYVADLVARGVPLPMLFLIEALRMEGVLIDSLHAVDQGIASHILGNIIFETMRLGQWGNNMKVQLEGLVAYLNNWYSRNRSRNRIQGKLTMERIKTSAEWPKLKAKGAATRHFAFFCRDLLAEHGYP